MGASDALNERAACFKVRVFRLAATPPDAPAEVRATPAPTPCTRTSYCHAATHNRAAAIESPAWPVPAAAPAASIPATSVPSAAPAAMTPAAAAPTAMAPTAAMAPAATANLRNNRLIIWSNGNDWCCRCHPGQHDHRNGDRRESEVSHESSGPALACPCVKPTSARYDKYEAAAIYFLQRLVPIALFSPREKPNAIVNYTAILKVQS